MPWYNLPSKTRLSLLIQATGKIQSLFRVGLFFAPWFNPVMLLNTGLSQATLCILTYLWLLLADTELKVFLAFSSPSDDGGRKVLAPKSLSPVSTTPTNITSSPKAGACSANAASRQEYRHHFPFQTNTVPKAHL